jgi:hypothetical protein
MPYRDKSMRERVEKLLHQISGEPAQPDHEDVVLGLSPSGFHEIAYVGWGPAGDPRPEICVHGLTRQGRDFDYLATRLAASRRRVICPDLPGRGRMAGSGIRTNRAAAAQVYPVPPDWAKSPGDNSSYIRIWTPANG